MNVHPSTSQSPVDSKLAIASLVCGIATWVILPVLGALAAIVTGHMAFSEINKSQGMLKGKGMAIVGLASGYLQVVILLLFLQVSSR